MRKRIDLSGRRIGKLLVLSPAPDRITSKGKKLTCWTCECSCRSGEFVTVSTADLTSKHPTRSCGCGFEKDEYIEVGLYKSIAMHPYGWLTPIGYLKKSFIRARLGNFTIRPFWLCRCKGQYHKDPLISSACERWVRVSSTDIRKGRVYSCTLCSKACKLERWQSEKQEIEHEEIHGVSESRRKVLTRRSYDGMLYRYRHDPAYRARGIHMGWLRRNGYQQFIADMGLRPGCGFSIHRIDSYVGYFPSNCTWTDRATQSRWRTDSRVFQVEGERTNLIDLATRLGKRKWYISRWIDRLMGAGFTEPEAIEQILSTAHYAA